MSSNYDNVFMIGWEYPPHNSGGLGTACAGMTQALAGMNTNIFFTLPYQFSEPVGHMKILNCADPSWNQPNQPPFQAYAAAKNIKLDQRLNVAELSSLPTSDLEQKVERYSQLVNNAASQVKDKFDVIHAHDWMSFPAAINLKQKTHKPMIAHVHSTEFDRIPTGHGSHYITHTEYEGMMAADRVIAVSFYTKRLLMQKYQIDEQKIEVVHNGIDTPIQSSHRRSTFANKRPVVVFMGRLTMQKGPEFFLAVANQVLAVQPDCLFVLAGSGDMYQELLLRSAGSGLTASVLFSGFVRDQQKDKLLSRADIFVMPSVSEPFGLVAVEAAQRRTPVIVSKTAGVNEVLPGCVAVDFWDIDEMAQTVLKLLNDKGFSRKVVAQQLSALPKISWKNSAKKIKGVYQQAFLG